MIPPHRPEAVPGVRATGGSKGSPAQGQSRRRPRTVFFMPKKISVGWTCSHFFSISFKNISDAQWCITKNDCKCKVLKEPVPIRSSFQMSFLSIPRANCGEGAGCAGQLRAAARAGSPPTQLLSNRPGWTLDTFEATAIKRTRLQWTWSLVISVWTSSNHTYNIPIIVCACWTNQVTIWFILIWTSGPILHFIQF